MGLNSFYPGTTKCFSVAITHDGGTPNITGDVVTFRMKLSPADSDAAAVVTAVADVLTSGATGVALVELTPDDTKALRERNHYYDVEWRTAAGDEYIVASGEVRVMTRVSDVPA